MVLSLERCADLHMAQLMPLPLTVSCFSIIRIGFTFLTPAHLGSPGQRAVKRVCVRAVSSVRLLQLLQFAMLRRTVYGNSKGFEVKVGMHQGSGLSPLLFVIVILDFSRPRGRPKKTWKEVVREDCQARKLNKEDAMDRCKWRKVIKEAR